MDWISVKEHGNPQVRLNAWVFLENGRVRFDLFCPEDVGTMHYSNAYEGLRESDGWFRYGLNAPGSRVTHYIPIEPSYPPDPPKEENP